MNVCFTFNCFNGGKIMINPTRRKFVHRKLNYTSAPRGLLADRIVDYRSKGIMPKNTESVLPRSRNDKDKRPKFSC